VVYSGSQRSINQRFEIIAEIIPRDNPREKRTMSDRQYYFPAISPTVLLGIAACLMLASSPFGPSFQGLGDLPGGADRSVARSVSDDGKVVVGNAYSAAGYEAFRWTSGGMIGLGDLPGAGVASGAGACSADGLVLVGSGSKSTSFNAIRWTFGDGMVELGSLPGGGADSSARAISDDGSVIAGWADSAPASGVEAFRWTSGSGMVGLGNLGHAVTYSSAEDMSADGSVIVGQSWSASGREGFLWTSGGGMVGLGDLPGEAFSSEAHGVSADGLTVVGSSRSASGTEAFRWNSGSMTGLGDLPGGSFDSEARATSGDGSIIVGTSETDLGNEAFIWDSVNGMRNLETVLNDQGVNTAGWQLEIAHDITPDGRFVVGEGRTPPSAIGTQAFLVDLTGGPPPTPASSDWSLVVMMIVLATLGLASIAIGKRTRQAV
jgi:probable HAF family extracellular repeat protein